MPCQNSDNWFIQCSCLHLIIDAERISEYELKLMDIDSEHLGIPDTEYDATVKMSGGEFQRICRDLATIGDSVTISANKDSIKFATSGELGSGNVTIRNGATVDKARDLLNYASVMHS